MGKKLVIKGADFSANGIKETTSVISEFEANVLPLGTAIRQASGTSAITQSQSTTRVGIVYTDLSLYSGTLKIRPKSGFQLALIARNGNAWITSTADGTMQNEGNFTWVTVETDIEIDIETYTEVAVNIRYANNVTEFTSNDISLFIDKAIVE